MRSAVPAPAQFLIEVLLLHVTLQNLEPDQLRLAKVTIGKTDIAQAIAQAGDRGTERFTRLMIGCELAE